MTEPIAPPAPFWGSLPPRRYQVGFHASWHFNSARVFDSPYMDKSTDTQGKKAPRPFLVNQWAPVVDPTAMSMTAGDYVHVHADDPTLAKLETRFTELNTQTVSRAIVGKTEGRSPEEQAVLDGFFQRPMAAVRSSAVPTETKFPLVIYIQGYGGTTEDNVVLCEWLASQGYVVLGGSFQNEDGTMISSREVVAGDIDFLVSLAARMPYVDWNHIGLIGHSGGAQSSLMYQSTYKSAIDAVVSLDTTQDYHPVNFALHKDFVASVKPAEMTGSLLAVADAGAIFSLPDQCTGADRIYLTFKHVEHNEYISHKVIGNDYLDQYRREPVRQDYESLCVFIGAFLDAKLKLDPEPLDRLLAHYGAPQFDERRINVELMPTGMDAPPPYDPASSVPPTPRQMWAIFQTQSVSSGAALLKKYWQADANHPNFSYRFGFALVNEILEQDQAIEARQICRLYRSLMKRSLIEAKDFLRWGQLYREWGNVQRATEFYRKALMLAPKNNEALRQISLLETNP